MSSPRLSAGVHVASDRLLPLVSTLAVLLALAPIVLLLFSWRFDESDIWQHLLATQLPTLLRNTLVLVVGVGIGVSLLGIALAWLTVMCEFPGRRFFDWALMLPLAVPAYVLGFAALGIFDFSGPLQQGLQRLIGEQYLFVDVRGDVMVVAVMVLVLYPYVYMLSRSAFLAQSPDVIEAARSLGLSSWGAFYKVVLPMARPAIVAGVSLALMETLADFGTVAVFNYDTFTTAIYKSWFALFNLQAAAQLASVLLLFVALALTGERYSRGGRSFVQSSRRYQHQRFQLSRPRALAASAFCLLVLSLAFVSPLLQLLYWAVGEGLDALDSRYFALLKHTLLLGAAAALTTIVVALVLAFNRRRSTAGLALFFDLATLGYALPGSVLAVGLMLCFALLDRELIGPLQTLLGVPSAPLLLGSVGALIIAYSIRFLAVASGPVQSSLERIGDSIPQAARSLGARRWRLLRQIYLPMLRPGLLTAAVLVLVDVMKEMPATLLLRPFGWDTLAVRVYEMTSEGEWQRAALPALTLVAVGLVPVVLALRQSSAGSMSPPRRE